MVFIIKFVNLLAILLCLKSNIFKKMTKHVYGDFKTPTNKTQTLTPLERALIRN